MHRNMHYVNTMGRAAAPWCGPDRLLLKVAWVADEARGLQNYPKRFQSAEGCYSQRAVATRGIRIRVAHKQFVGLTVPLTRSSIRLLIGLAVPSRCAR